MASDYSHSFLKHRLYIEDLMKDIPGIIWGSDLNSPRNGLSSGFSDVCIAQFEKEEELKFLVWIENKVIFYDFKDGAWKSLYDMMPGVDMQSLDEHNHYLVLILFCIIL
ncbi:hypothetical protein PTKIN_Ptkin06aG0146400 [Pterospermum kingtungense]